MFIDNFIDECCAIVNEMDNNIVREWEGGG